MANEDKRIIELPASESILNDDWIAKDSASQDTTRLQLSFLKQLCGGNNFAGEWIAGHSYQFESYVTHEGKLYHNISGGNIQDSTWNASHWSEITVSGELIHLTSSIASWFRTSVSYKVGDIVIYNNRLYQCNTAHPAGAWNDSHFGILSLNSVISGLKNRIYSDLAPTFVYTNSYNVGDYVTDGNYLYQCIVPHTGGWNSSHFRQVNVGDMLEEIVDNFASTFSPSTSYSVGQFVVHNNTFYRCNTPHTGAWNWEHFSLTSVSDLVGRILFDIALPFSTTTNYAVGDYVTYNTYLYKCTTAHSAGTWNASHFTSVKVMDVIKEKVTDVQIAGQTTTDENHISDLTSLAIEGTASGEIATFNDGSNLPMRSFICNIDAVQDLHGYDAPWAGGAGKNKFPILIGDDVWIGNQGATYTSSNGVLIIESLAPTNTSSGVYSSSNSKMRELVATLDGEYVYSFEIKCNKEASITCGISNHGNIARTVSTNWVRYEIPTTFSIGENAGCVFYNYSKTENLEIQVRNFMIQQGTTATPYEPYENICPILGHSGVDAWVRGKNLLPMTVDGIKAANTSGAWSGNAYTYNGIVYTILTDNNNNVTGINADGTATDTGFFNIDFGGQIPVGDYYANGGVDGGSYDTYDVYFWDGTTNARMTKWDGTTPSVSLFNTTTSAEIRVLNTTDALRYRIRIRSGVNVDNKTFYPMIRLATETDSTYEPYNPQSQSIQVSWQTEAGEVYGGYVDLVSGVLTIDRVSVEYEGSNDEAWTMSTGGSGDTSWHQFYTPRTSAKNSLNAICNRFPTKDIAYRGTESLLVAYTDRTFRIALKDSDLLITSVDDWKTWLSTNNLQLVYELATPITYQLTPTQIKSLLGNNNAWCDTGDVNVKYNKDATTVINSLISRIEALENA